MYIGNICRIRVGAVLWKYRKISAMLEVKPVSVKPEIRYGRHSKTGAGADA
jgi:hypothetical protein